MLKMDILQIQFSSASPTTMMSQDSSEELNPTEVPFIEIQNDKNNSSGEYLIKFGEIFMIPCFSNILIPKFLNVMQIR